MSRSTPRLVDVNLLAASIVKRIEKSSRQLATKIEFSCNNCHDDGFVEREGRHERCKCRSKSTEPQIERKRL